MVRAGPPGKRFISGASTRHLPPDRFGKLQYVTPCAFQAHSQPFGIIRIRRTVKRGEPGMNLVPQGRQVVCEFLRIRLPMAVQRR